MAEGLVVGRGGFRLPPIDLSLQRGETFAVLGPTGAGKSTLLLTLAGLLPRRAGALSIDGRDPAAVRNAERARLAAYAPAPGEVDTPLDVTSLVRLGRVALGGCTRAEAVSALDRVRAAALATSRFDRLSSGERQLVLLARTFVQGAHACLFDEPTASLDPGRRAAVTEVLQTLCAEGRIVVVATHDLDLAQRAHAALWIGGDGRVETLDTAALNPTALAARYL